MAVLVLNGTAPQALGSADCSWLELAVDFEVATRVPLPTAVPTRRRRKAGPRIPPRSLADRAQRFPQLLREVQRLTATPLLPPRVRDKRLCHSARQHGMPPRAGLSARPEPLGAEATRAAWRQHIASIPDAARLDTLLLGADRSHAPLRGEDWAEQVFPEFSADASWSLDHARNLVLGSGPGATTGPRRRLRRRPTVTESPAPDVDRAFRLSSGKRFHTTCDLVWGYTQAMLTSRASRLLACVSRSGITYPVRAPFGPCDVQCPGLAGLFPKFN